MPDDAPDGVWVVPTEMGRRDVAFEVFALLLAGVGVYWWWNVPALHVFSVWPVLALLGLLVVWMLTGEGAADLPFVGAIAGPLRARIGQRRVHEWAVVYTHYFYAGPWPRFCHATRVRIEDVQHIAKVRVDAGWRRFVSIRVRTWR